MASTNVYLDVVGSSVIKGGMTVVILISICMWATCCKEVGAVSTMSGSTEMLMRWLIVKLLTDGIKNFQNGFEV